MFTILLKTTINKSLLLFLGRNAHAIVSIYVTIDAVTITAGTRHIARPS